MDTAVSFTGFAFFGGGGADKPGRDGIGVRGWDGGVDFSVSGIQKR